MTITEIPTTDLPRTQADPPETGRTPAPASWFDAAAGRRPATSYWCVQCARWHESWVA